LNILTFHPEHQIEGAICGDDTQVLEFESLKLTDPKPEWVGPKVVLIRSLLADLESTLQ
jgi:hypothetical protein